MITERLAALVSGAAQDLLEDRRLEEPLPPAHVERPRESGHGDWSTNVAMVLASKLQEPPRSVAEDLVRSMGAPDYLESIEIAGPGFINFRLSPDWLQGVVDRIADAGDDYGRSQLGQGTKVLVEFVSANPVGPMHIGHGRWAAVGDSLAALLEFSGHQVTREFYLNDYGNQMRLFGESVAVRLQQVLGGSVELPADGYQGSYIKDIAQTLVEDGVEAGPAGEEGWSADVTDRAYKIVLENIRRTLEQMEVRFDVWFSERELHRRSKVMETIDLLRDRGLVFSQDGAEWLRTTSLGDDRDRVLVRENGEPTYFAADIAYHRDKLDRGYDLLVNIWGADHHGYVPRMRAAVEALVEEAGILEIIIGQLVNLARGGRPVKMSKRTGEMVTLEELIEEVGRDPVRYWFLTRSTDTPLDFDIDLAKSHTTDNPVYYAQYAHARIASIIRVASDEGIEVDGGQADLSRLTEDSELALLRVLDYGSLVYAKAAEKRAPHRLTQYADELATAFHHFYHKCRVVTDDIELSRARLAMISAAGQVMRNTLRLAGVSAPESM